VTTHPTGSEKIARIEHEAERLQLLLDRGTWPEGLPLLPSEVRVIRHNLDLKLDVLARLRRVAEMERGGGYEDGPG
jgi:hypothetical protein